MKKINELIAGQLGVFLLLTLNSCSKVGFLNNERMLTEINNTGDFLKVFIILQISIIFLVMPYLYF